MNKILIEAFNETFRQCLDPVDAHTPIRNVRELRTFNPKLRTSPEAKSTTSTPIHARAWKEKALAGYDSQQIPTNNNIHKMLIIIISLRWKHFVITSYLYKIPTINEPYNQRERDIRQTHTDILTALTSPTDGSQLSFILSLKNCIMRTNL